MKKSFTLALAVLAAAGSFGVRAEVTSAEALKEAFSFSAATPVPVGVCTYAKDTIKNGTNQAGQVEIAGWTIPENGDTRAGGVYLTGSSAWLGGKEYIAPATTSAGKADEKVMGVLGVWTGTVQYTLPVELAPKEYTLTMQVYNKIGGTADVAKNLIGFIAEDGTEYLSDAKTFAVDTWTTISVPFKLEAATKGNITIGFKAPDKGSGSCPHLFISNLALHYAGEPTADKTAMLAAIAEAEAKKLGFDTGEYAPYNNAEALKALTAAKALVEETVYEQEIVDAATAALKAAVWTVNTEELNAVYNGTFHLSQPDAAAPYWSNVSNGGYGNSRVFVYAKPTAESDSSYIVNYGYMGALQPNDTLRAALYLRYNENPGAWYNYGTTEAAYAMPLKKDTEYIFSVDFGQWGEGDGENNIQIYDAADSIVFAAMNVHADHLNTADNPKATRISGTFKPSVDGNCRISLWSPGNKKHFNVFTNFKVMKAPSRDNLFGNYTVDSLKAQERNYVSSDNEWHALELKNYAASLAPTANADTVILQGLLSTEGLLYGTLNLADMTINFHPQAVDSLFFCSQADYSKGVVATIDPEFNIVLNGWTLINAADSTVYVKDAECNLSKGAPVMKDQTITWDQTFDGIQLNTPVTLEATASSGLAVEYVLAETTIATLEGNVLTFTEAGEVTVTAKQPGDFYYNAAAAVEKKITAKPAGIESIDADAALPVYYNLQGIEVKNPQPGHIYIEVRGSRATKLVK